MEYIFIIGAGMKVYNKEYIFYLLYLPIFKTFSYSPDNKGVIIGVVTERGRERERKKERKENEKERKREEK